LNFYFFAIYVFIYEKSTDRPPSALVKIVVLLHWLWLVLELLA